MNKKLGYYLCNGLEFESKIQAMQYANPSNLPIKWIFNNPTFDPYTWSIEPDLTVDQLYNRRAREIRDSYDYVILSYSGGSDSNNVLQSFLRQNLFIDEIITNWTLDASEKYLVFDKNERSPWNTAAEFKLHTASRLDYIKSVSPATKITMYDSTNMMLESLSNAKDGSWVEEQNDVLNITGVTVFNSLYFSEVRKRFDRDKKIAYITGLEKPKLMIQNNSLYLYFVDKAANIAPVNHHLQEYPNAENVFFYWAPECADLICKQAHVVFKYLKLNPQYKDIFQRTDAVALRRLQEEFLRTVIYTTWDTSWFQVRKTVNDWDCEFDYWFSRGLKGTKEHNIWLEGLKYIAPRINNFLSIRDGKLFGSAPLISNKYFIGTFNE